MKSRIIVQSDWNEVLREKGGRAWIAYKLPGSETVYSELKTQLSADARVCQTKVSASDGFSVEHFTHTELTISYLKLCRTNFQAPCQLFTQVHTPHKSVACIDVTPGGLAVSCNNAGQLLVWTTNNGEVRRCLSGHYGDVYACRYFPSGLVILSGGADTLVKIWSAETGQCAATLAGHSAGVTDLAVIERGRNVISTCRDGSAKLWDCSKSACITTLTGSAGDVINGCCLVQTAPDVDLRSPDHTPDEREVSTGGKMLLLACESGLLHAFGLQSRKKIMTMSLTSPVNCCASVNETLIVCGTQDSTVHGIDLRNTSQPVISLQEARSAILSILPLKQTCFVTTGDGSCFTSNVCALSKSFDNSCCLELTGPDCDPVYRAATDGHNVFTCCRDSVIRKYQLNTDWSTF